MLLKNKKLKRYKRHIMLVIIAYNEFGQIPAEAVNFKSEPA